MNKTNLATFIAVMQTGSLSQAANTLFVTQPAVSKRIKTLENELGVVLFDNLGRGILPTHAAHAFLPVAKRWLAEYHAIKLALHDDSTAKGVLRLCTSHHIGLHYLPPLLKKYQQNYPLVQLSVQFLDSEAANVAVDEGTADVAFLTLPTNVDDNVDRSGDYRNADDNASHYPGSNNDYANLSTDQNRLNYHPLWQDPLQFVAAPNHPLARLTKTLSAQNKPLPLIELGRHHAILPDSNTYTTRHILATLRHAGLSPTFSTPTNPLESIRMLVSIGLGWSVLPQSLVNSELSILQPALPTGVHLTLTRTLGAAVNPHLTKTLAATKLLEMLGIA